MEIKKEDRRAEEKGLSASAVIKYGDKRRA